MAIQKQKKGVRQQESGGKKSEERETQRENGKLFLI